MTHTYFSSQVGVGKRGHTVGLTAWQTVGGEWQFFDGVALWGLYISVLARLAQVAAIDRVELRKQIDVFITTDGYKKQ